ncbi:MAG: glycoside hydrolase domain-containing protein [Longimicrobiaceae bacterium]
MSLTGTVRKADPGVLGLDFNADGQKMTAARAKAFREAGYRFCLRYVPREATAKTVDFDLRKAEAQMLLDEGFALMAVQHFKSEKGWTPTPQLGRDYGAFAARWAQEKVELPPGVCVFLDLEAVKSGTPKQDIIDYCAEWHQQVLKAGYVPGVYLGTGARLADTEVAAKLPSFEHFWIAFNETFEVPGRGIQLKQILVKKNDPLRPPGTGGFIFQADRTSIDQKGGIVSWVAPS